MASLFAEASVPELVRRSVKAVPQEYIRFPDGLGSKASSDSAVNDAEQGELPVIDMSDVGTTEGRKRLGQEINRACREWGFFHVVSHGVDLRTLQTIQQAVHEFFDLPMEEKMELFSAEPRPEATRYGVRFDSSSGVQDWRDFLDMGKCHPFDDETMSSWPVKPDSFRSAALQYAQQARRLALNILSLIAEGLGLPPDRFEKAIETIDQTLLCNRYLPCPEPHLVLGLRNHSDPGLITLLLTNNVSGLQVKASGSWITVQSQPDSIVVNLGDQMEILSNRMLTSVEHRVLANPENTRYSIASFFIPSTDAIVKPLPELVDKDHPPQYREVTFQDYVKIYVEQKLSSKRTLEVLQTTI